MQRILRNSAGAPASRIRGEGPATPRVDTSPAIIVQFWCLVRCPSPLEPGGKCANARGDSHARVIGIRHVPSDNFVRRHHPAEMWWWSCDAVLVGSCSNCHSQFLLFARSLSGSLHLPPCPCFRIHVQCHENPLEENCDREHNQGRKKAHYELLDHGGCRIAAEEPIYHHVANEHAEEHCEAARARVVGVGGQKASEQLVLGGKCVQNLPAHSQQLLGY